MINFVIKNPKAKKLCSLIKDHAKTKEVYYLIDSPALCLCYSFSGSDSASTNDKRANTC